MSEERTVSVRNGMFETRLREYGAPDAPPLLFLHGYNDLQQDEYLDRLGERFRVIAPWHPGFGESTGIEHLDDVIDVAVYYYDFLDAIGVENAHVVGHSLGGMFAAEIAALDPSRVRRLVLSAPLGLWRDDAPPLDFFAERTSAVNAALWADPEAAHATSHRPDPNDKDAMLASMFDTMRSMTAAAKFLWPIPDKGLKKRIHRISAPALIVWGDRDGIVPPLYAEEFRSRIAGSRVAMMAGCAHMPMIERPDEWVSLVAGFLAESA